MSPLHPIDLGDFGAPGEPGGVRAQRRRDSPFALIAAVVVLLLSGAILTAVVLRVTGLMAGPLHDPGAMPRLVVPRGDLAGDEQSTIALFRAAAPSVVHINTSKLKVERSFFSSNVLEIPEGSGSGFVWDESGHVVTNFHVIQNANRIFVTLQDGSTWEARLVGAEPDYDLAVLKLDLTPGRSAPGLPVGSSGDLLVGQKVFAIGNPFGLDHTLTTGVISGLGREILSVTERPISDVIQTDAAINPGNSGGPLLDSAGRLIGVNTSILTRTGASSGVGFAVPVDTVNRIVPLLIRSGRVERPAIGIRILNDRLATQLGAKGVVISEILPGSPAMAAGLEAIAQRDGAWVLGDTIVGLDGREVLDQADLFTALEAHVAGDEVELVLEREGRRRRVQLTLTALR